MLNLTRPNFESIRRTLLRQQKVVEDELKSIQSKDPVLETALAESSEPGTESWMADVHNQAVVLKENLQNILDGIKRSLLRLKSGSYGKCEKCGREIEAKRLEIMPTATLCVSCSKKGRK